MVGLSSILIQQPQVQPEIVEPIVEVIEIKYEDPVKDYAYWQIVDKWGEAEWEAFNYIISRESANWTVLEEHYPTGYTKDGIKSSAYGLGGFLDGTWAGVGCTKTNDPYKQIDCTIKYIEQRPLYGTPSKAKAFHLANNYY